MGNADCVGQKRRFRQNKRITDGKVPDVIREIRNQSEEEKKSKMKPGGMGHAAPLYVASPVTRVSGNPVTVPVDYSQLDYAPQEDDRRNVAQWPYRERAEILPQFEGTHGTVDDDHPLPDYKEEELLGRTNRTMKEIGVDETQLSEHLRETHVSFY